MPAAAARRSLGWQLGDYRLALLFGGSVVLLGAALYWYADRIAMGMVGARELLPGEAPALHAAVERLAARAGVVEPRLYLLPDGYPRALSAGRGARRRGARGVVGAARRRDAGRARGRSSRTSSRICAAATCCPDDRGRSLAAAIVEASRIGGCLQRALLFVLGPLAASFVHLVLSPKREYEADRFAADLCGSPHGLADALLRLEQSMELVEFQASPATEPLYTIEPVRATRASRRSSSRTRRSASACAGCASSTPSGARSCARPRRRRRPKGPVAGPFAEKWAASYSPGRLLSEYHRR